MRYESTQVIGFDKAVSTDDIIAGKHKHASTDPAELACHVFENLAPGLARSIVPGTALVSSAIFGIGSSREQAVTALRAAGVNLIVAPSFGRIFYRNCWNNGLPAIELPVMEQPLPARICYSAEDGALWLDGRYVSVEPASTLQLSLLEHGGLLALLRVCMQEARAARP